ncbi:hypothetical protein FBU30_004098 [Linnemannia zychae]|nr:hypothetical protein FBU30_004098 [Linnemannia zychae]
MLWKRPNLKGKIQSMIIDDHYYDDITIVPSQGDAREWLTTIAPGRLITTFLMDVGLPADKHNVTNLLAGDPSQAAILSLDLRALCLLGAIVSLPPGQTTATLKCHLSEGNQRKMKPRRSKRKPGDRKRRKLRQKIRKLSSQPQTTRYFDLIFKRNAVSQPTKNFSSWLENHKNIRGASPCRTIQELESTLPSLKG